MNTYGISDVVKLLEFEKAAQEAFAIRVLGKEQYDNSPCQAHPLELVEAEIIKLQKHRKLMIQLLLDCAEHFKTLRGANVFVWPNHPLNPEKRIAEVLSSRFV